MGIWEKVKALEEEVKHLRALVSDLSSSGAAEIDEEAVRKIVGEKSERRNASYRLCLKLYREGFDMRSIGKATGYSAQGVRHAMVKALRMETGRDVRPDSSDPDWTALRHTRFKTQPECDA
jgi:hypothetical protein